MAKAPKKESDTNPAAGSTGDANEPVVESFSSLGQPGASEPSVAPASKPPEGPATGGGPPPTAAPASGPPGAPVPPETPPPANPAVETEPVWGSPTLTVVLSWGDVLEADADLLAVGRYGDMPLTGAVGAIDRALGYILTGAVDMGMLHSALGELFYFPNPWLDTATRLKARAVVIAGMGETGHFGREDLRYLMTNVGFAALQLRTKRVSTVLMGTEGSVMTPERSLRAIVDGFLDALERYQKIILSGSGESQAWQDIKKQVRQSGPPQLVLEIVESRFLRFAQLYQLLKEWKEGGEVLPFGVDPTEVRLPPVRLIAEPDARLGDLIKALKPYHELLATLQSHQIATLIPALKNLRLDGFPPFLKDLQQFKGLVEELDRLRTGEDDVAAVASEPSSSCLLRLTVTALRRPAEGFEFPTLGGPPKETTPTPTLTSDRLLFQYTALSNAAVIPMREVEVQPYFAERLPPTMVGSSTLESQRFYGLLLATYFLPQDFRRLIESGQTLTLALDSTTAVFPWEMAAVQGQRDVLFFGLDLGLTRQFRTLAASSPGIAPPIDDEVNILIIADPSSMTRPLVDAREEAIEIVQLLARAHRQWQGRVRIKVTVRVGEEPELWRSSPGSEGGDLQARFEKIQMDSRLNPADADSGIKLDLGEPIDRKGHKAAVCVPVQLLGLLLNNHYDVVHYTGHAMYDPRSGKKGWILNEDCIFSATEVLQTRNVPRLVFANACVSGTIDSQGEKDRVRRQSPVDSREMSQYVSVIEAFFSRGLPNYIGPGWGWEVPSKSARQFAVDFYSEALGLGENRGTVACFGEAMVAARRASRKRLEEQTGPIREDTMVWCAFQHYGQYDARLVSPPRR